MLVRKVALLAAAASALVVVLRMFFGPLRLISTVGAPLNAEGVFGLAVTILLATAARDEARGAPVGSGRAWVRAALACAVAAVMLLALSGSLRFYFLSDDFVIAKRAATVIPQNLRAQFTEGGGDGMYRPIGNVSLALSSAWAGFDPLRWHISALALHVANCLLVLLLAWRIGASRWAGLFAAVLFGIHGACLEAAVWIAGRFDLLATLFVLAGLLLLARSCAESGARRYIFQAGALGCLILAVLTKESAYVFPFLVLLYLISKRGTSGHRITAAVPFFVAAAVVFAYRWSLFGGIGGYVVGGKRQAFSLGLTSTLKALVMRLWAVLYFPINWTVEPGIVLGLLALASVICLLWLAFTTRPGGRLWFPLGFVLVAVVPPLHLLLIGAHLGNARVLYLPAVGFCLFLALAVDGLNRWPRHVIPVVILVFNLAVLQHNLDCWEYTSAKTKSACEAAAQYARPGRKLAVAGMPMTIRGVPFFANGMADCVEMNTHRPADIEVIRDGRIPDADEGTVLLIWEESRERLTCARCTPESRD